MRPIRRALGTLLVLGSMMLHGSLAQNLSEKQGPGAQNLAQSPSDSAVPVALPRGIKDLSLLLQSYVPDPERVRKLRQKMEAEPGPGSPAELAVAWHERSMAAEALQENELRAQYLSEALRYARQAPEIEPSKVGGLMRVRKEANEALRPLQGLSATQDANLAFTAELEANAGPNMSWLIGMYANLAENYIAQGDLDNAQRYLAKLDNALRTLAGRRNSAIRMPNWLRQAEAVRGRLYLSQGKLAEAEKLFLSNIRQSQEALRMVPARQSAGIFTVNPDRGAGQLDSAQLLLTHAYIAQERLDEAELLLREVLKSALVREGRDSIRVGKTLATLAEVMMQRGRYADAVALVQWAEVSMTEAGMSELSPPRAGVRMILANALTGAGKADQATAIIDNLRSKIADDPRLEQSYGKGSPLSIRAFMQTGRLTDALRDADSLLAHHVKHFGQTHSSTAEARAYRAMVLHRSGKVAEARREFDAATATLLQPGRTGSRQDASVARTQRLRTILNENLNVLVGNKGLRTEADIAQAFLISDVARWQTVQKAVAGSALRSAAGSPELAAKIKKVQDADDEIQAVYKNLISLRSMPPERQLPAVIKAMEERIATLHRETDADLADIRKNFPQYDALVNPRPADVAAARKALLPGEALLSVYVNSLGAYVWALGPDGKLNFHFSNKPADWLTSRVKRLRNSVDLTTGVDTSRMRYDLQAGAEIYQELLAPVQQAWDKAHTLVVVANEPLGQIPFSMLPTSLPIANDSPSGLPLAQYRSVEWMARKVAIAYVPSVSNLVTLRALAPTKGNRAAFIGYGDPDFGSGAAAPGTRSVATGIRNLQISAQLPEDAVSSGMSPGAALPVLNALPDTRDEITAIATALSADIRRDAFFGQNANPQAVMQGDLKRRRVVAFATHGLVAGDLPGLDQPALALSPTPGKTIYDGLLKLEDILKLSLDADLVVLSACNTAASDGVGAEAVSGLGRGFFYAGARSVLATHWPVETVSARQLVTHLFERYAREDKLTRAQALRAAMLQLIDTDMAVDSRGQAIATYAHPAFWAPYALYGDPGR